MNKIHECVEDCGNLIAVAVLIVIVVLGAALGHLDAGILFAALTVPWLVVLSLYILGAALNHVREQNINDLVLDILGLIIVEVLVALIMIVMVFRVWGV